MRSIQPRISEEVNLWPRQAKKLGIEPRYRFGGCFFYDIWRMDDSGGGKNVSHHPFTDFHHFIMLLDEIGAGRDSDHSVFRNRHLLNGLIAVFKSVILSTAPLEAEFAQSRMRAVVASSFSTRATVSSRLRSSLFFNNADSTLGRMGG